MREAAALPDRTRRPSEADTSGSASLDLPGVLRRRHSATRTSAPRFNTPLPGRGRSYPVGWEFPIGYWVSAPTGTSMAAPSHPHPRPGRQARRRPPPVEDHRARRPEGPEPWPTKVRGHLRTRGQSSSAGQTGAPSPQEPSPLGDRWTCLLRLLCGAAAAGWTALQPDFPTHEPPKRYRGRKTPKVTLHQPQTPSQSNCASPPHRGHAAQPPPTLSPRPGSRNEPVLW
jgi:hypothetical protein